MFKCNMYFQKLLELNNKKRLRPEKYFLLINSLKVTKVKR